MDITNWKIVNTKKVYKNPHFKIIEQAVIRPDGTDAIYYTLVRKSDFSIIIPLTEQNETYLVGQYRIASQKFSWEFPMGGVDGKEPLDTAKQELIEETGLTAKSWKKLGSFYVANGHTSQKANIFLAHDLTQGDPQPEAGEFLEIKKVPIKQIGLMIKQEEITDGPTIFAYQAYQLHS